ncbi:MAG: hypothetical protein ACREOG_17240 [Gemmatimonadaceae bacterium]
MKQFRSMQARTCKAVMPRWLYGFDSAIAELAQREGVGREHSPTPNPYPIVVRHYPLVVSSSD